MQRKQEWSIISALVLAAACASVDQDGSPSDGVDRGAPEPSVPTPPPPPPPPAPAIGDPLPGTNAALFAEARATFAAVETIEDGIGPVFNGTSCAGCHSSPAIGGFGAQVERRYGRVTAGVFFGFDRAPENHGGTLRQLFSNGTYTTDAGVTCTIPLEQEPATANVNNVGRRSTSLFGLGLVDAMPDAWFDALAASQPPSIRGVARRVSLVFPDPRDPSQAIGRTRVARFGHKGEVPGLLTFSADAYLNEMGITTQSCYQGTPILAFALENYANNVAPPAACNGGDLRPANPTGNPDVPEFTDDVVGDCGGGRTEIQDDVGEFLFFMERLAPPAPLPLRPDAQAGGQQFRAAGCEGCHTGVTFVTPPHPFNGVPGAFRFRPYSDFLVHDMGALGDGIGNTGDSLATTRLMRTAPLWGARYATRFLHDARAGSVREAILAHDGQARRSRDAFAALSAAAQRQIEAFIRSL